MATVVLIHGLWVNGWDMAVLKWRLGRAGYKTYRFAYPSVRNDLSQNASLLNRFLRNIPSQPIDLVAHSLGGLLIRQTLHEYPDLPIGRIVTLATPHQGSESAHGVQRVPMGNTLLGKSVQQGIFAANLPWDPAYEIGSIAGNRSLGLGRLFCDLTEPNDGTVTVEETRMDGLKDHIVLPVNHMGMSLNKEVARNVLAFLQAGRFIH